MKIDLSFNNREEGFVVPINPPELEITSTQANKRVSLVNLGEINLSGKRGLKSLSFSSFFPSEKSPFFKEAKMSPSDYISMIKKWKNSGKPIRVIITDGEINLAMLIDEFNYTVIEGRGDIKYTLKLSEYKFLNVEAIKEGVRSIKKNGLKERPVEKKNTDNTYVVKEGDSLWSISKRFLGDGGNYKKIYEANKSLIDARNKNASKYTIYPAQRLVIPV